MAKREIEKLSESIIENARIPEGKKERVLNDGGGLNLRLTPSSTKIQNQYWFYRFTRNGVKRKIGLGVYPDVSLALARKRCEGLGVTLSKVSDLKKKKNYKPFRAQES